MWEVLEWTVGDVEGVGASSSVIKSAKIGVLSSGYIWDVVLDSNGFVSAYVESTHSKSTVFKVRVHLGSHRVISSSCTCTTKNSVYCKHRVGLLYACAILANRITAHPPWLPRYPNYAKWRPTLVARRTCKSFDDLVAHLRSPLPTDRVVKDMKEKKKAPGRVRKPEDLVRLEMQRPKDTRLLARAPTGPRHRSKPKRYDDDE
jgi:hypothetical protein